MRERGFWWEVEIFEWYLNACIILRGEHSLLDFSWRSLSVWMCSWGWIRGDYAKRCEKEIAYKNQKKKNDERVGESKMGEQENKLLSCYLPRHWGGMRRRLRFKEQRIRSSRLLGRAYIKPWRSAVLARHVKNTHSHPPLFTSARQQCGETGCDERCMCVFIHSQQNIMKCTHFSFAAHLLFASISVSS